MKSIFISYAHRDEHYKDELKNHLVPLVLKEKIEIWDDVEIDAGSEWDEEIKGNLSEADIVLILISSNSIASTYIQNVEIKSAMDSHENGEKRVIPIILKPCKWEILQLGKLQALPKGAKPVSLWNSEDEAYLNIVEGIERVI